MNLSILNFFAFIGLGILSLTTSCNQNNPIDDGKTKLENQFNGQYRIINSTSDRPVDLNGDGIASINLLTENTLILHSELQIRYIDDLTSVPNLQFYIDLSWPIETNHRLLAKEPIIYTTPTYNPYYDIFMVSSFGKIESNNIIQVAASNNSEFATDKVVIHSLEMEKNNMYTLKSTCTVYSNHNWVIVNVISTYQRIKTAI